jgi:isoleucyl-tRNA synthetase
VVSLGAARKDGLRCAGFGAGNLISHEAGARRRSTAIDIIWDELNVKAVEWAEDEKEFVAASTAQVQRAHPRFGKQARQGEGPRNGRGDAPAGHIGSPLKVADSETGEERELGWVTAEVDGARLVVDTTCFEVHLEAKAETVAQRDGNLLLVLDTRVTEELKQEGLAREVVNRIQTRRKELNLDYADRISVKFSAPDELARALEAHRSYITGETLATVLERVDSLDADKVEAEIDGAPFSFNIQSV